MTVAGRVAFVTGASRGIGRAIALALRDQGARVVGTRTTESREPDLACHEWVRADFADVDQINACAASVRNLRPDILINNAGINRVANFVDIDPGDFLAVQQVNVLAPLLLCQAAIPSMKVRKRR